MCPTPISTQHSIRSIIYSNVINTIKFSWTSLFTIFIHLLALIAYRLTCMLWYLTYNIKLYKQKKDSHAELLCFKQCNNLTNFTFQKSLTLCCLCFSVFWNRLCICHCWLGILCENPDTVSTTVPLKKLVPSFFKLLGSRKVWN